MSNRPKYLQFFYMTEELRIVRRNMNGHGKITFQAQYRQEGIWYMCYDAQYRTIERLTMLAVIDMLLASTFPWALPAKAALLDEKGQIIARNQRRITDKPISIVKVGE